MCNKGFDKAERFREPKIVLKNNNNNKLKKQEISKEDISKLKFTKTLYKTITEILLQPNQTYSEKLEEWFEIEKEHNGLVDMKLDGGLGLADARKEKGYNKTIEEEKEEISKELLLVIDLHDKGFAKEIRNL